jgi:hypothetical protein
MARQAVIHAVQPYDLHGVRYYAIRYAYANEPDTLREARLAHDSIYPDPKAGDQILVEAILNVVTDITKAE